MAKVPWYALTPPPPKDRDVRLGRMGNGAVDNGAAIHPEAAAAGDLDTAAVYIHGSRGRQFSMVPPVITKLPA